MHTPRPYSHLPATRWTSTYGQYTSASHTHCTPIPASYTVAQWTQYEAISDEPHWKSGNSSKFLNTQEPKLNSKSNSWWIWSGFGPARLCPVTWLHWSLVSIYTMCKLRTAYAFMPHNANWSCLKQVGSGSRWLCAVNCIVCWQCTYRNVIA